MMSRRSTIIERKMTECVVCFEKTILQKVRLSADRREDSTQEQFWIPHII